MFAMSGIPFLPPEITIASQFIFQIILIMFVYARNKFSKTETKRLAVM